MMSDRDNCIRQMTKKLDDGSIFILAESIKHEEAPEQEEDPREHPIPRGLLNEQIPMFRSYIWSRSLVVCWLPSVDRRKKSPGSPGATYLAEAVLKLKKSVYEKSF